MTGQGYMPSTEQVRSHYVFSQSKRWHAERGASFDLWLAEQRREAAAEAWEAAVDCLSAHWQDSAPSAVDDLERRNPYRGGSDG